MYEDSLNEFIYDNQSLTEIYKEFSKEDKQLYKFEDEDDEKDKKFIMYDIIQDNYNKMKNSLLMFQKLLIKNTYFSSNTNKNEDSHLLNSDSIFPKNNSNENETKKLGKKREKQKKIHSKFSDDLIFIKVKVLYHKFLISLANDGYNSCEPSLSKDLFLKNLSGKIAQNSGKEYNKKLGELSLKDFLSNPISCHYSTFSESSNKRNIMNIYNNDKYKNLISLLDCNYKYLFKNFYIKPNCIELIEQNFNIKRRTYISFKESVNKLVEKENKDYINKVIEFAEEKFIWYLEGKRSKKKFIDYDIKLNDLFNIS